MAKARETKIVGLTAPVTITAAEAPAEGEKKSPAKFDATFYTGGALEIAGWDLPVVVDLAGLDRGNVLVANLDHDRTKRVGNFDVTNDGKSLVAHGSASAATASRDEVVASAADGYQWQASLEVNPKVVETIKPGKSVTVNGQDFSGPLYVTRKGVLKGFAFVSHGADDNTTASIAARAASPKEKTMEPQLKAWIESMGFVADELSEDQLAGLTANYNGKNGKKPAIAASSDPFEERKIEAKRRRELRDIANKYIDLKNADEDEIIAIERMHDHAIEAGMSTQEFRLELYESSVAPSSAPIRGAASEYPKGMLNKVLEAAICMHGRLPNHEKMFDDRVLQAAHDKFPRGISLKQVFLMAAQANGHRQHGFDVDVETQRAAFCLNGNRPIHGAGYSTVNLSNVVSNVANKYLRDGWSAVDQTPLRIAAIRPVNDFKQVTTVSLTGDLQFEKVGQDGQLKHGTIADMTYTNQADTYGRILAITRKDIINDDLGALTAVPRRIGRGGALKLNDIFWTTFLNNSSFFTSGNSNVSTSTGTMDVAGMKAAEAIFMAQTDPDGKPVGVMPAILLVPTNQKAAALQLMNSELLIDGTSSGVQGNKNIWQGRFRVESSPYMQNSSYTGYSSIAWYLLADPQEMPVIEIAALNGRVEPYVESADASFSTLGVEMRGYSDIGVSLQEYRGGVRADGD